MEKSMGKNPYYSGLQIINLDKDGQIEMINMFHASKEHSEQNILHIDVQNPETLTKVVKTVIKYYEGCADVKTE